MSLKVTSCQVYVQKWKIGITVLESSCEGELRTEAGQVGTFCYKEVLFCLLYCRYVIPFFWCYKGIRHMLFLKLHAVLFFSCEFIWLVKVEKMRMGSGPEAPEQSPDQNRASFFYWLWCFPHSRWLQKRLCSLQQIYRGYTSFCIYWRKLPQEVKSWAVV